MASTSPCLLICPCVLNVPIWDIRMPRVHGRVETRAWSTCCVTVGAIGPALSTKCQRNSHQRLPTDTDEMSGYVHAVLHLAGDGAQLATLVASNGRIASTLGLTAEQLERDDVLVATVMAAPTTDTLDRTIPDADGT